MARERIAIPDETSRVHLIWRFNAKPEALFNAWTDPSVMRRWLFKSQDNEQDNELDNDIAKIEIDLAIGGAFSILERNRGETIDHFGEYRTIERPRKLVFTLEVPQHFPGVTLVTLEISPDIDSSLLSFTQEGVAPEITEANWREMFTRLAEILRDDSVEHG